MASPSMMICCAVLGVLSVVEAASSGLRLHGNTHESAQPQQGGHQRSITKLTQAVEVEHQLVVCNAYASAKPLSIVLVRTGQKLTQDKPMKYKQCEDLTVPLNEGDQLDFKAGALEIGTFFATGLPKTSTSLLLVPHRKSPHSVGVTFESHAFADVKSPQIAVIDAYHGKSGNQAGAVRLVENMAQSAPQTPTEEDLKFNSVVAVNPGRYDVSITGNVASLPLNAVGADKYVIMRLGNEVEGTEGVQFPQELVVFPNRAVQLAMHLGIAAIVGATAIFGTHDFN